MQDFGRAGQIVSMSKSTYGRSQPGSARFGGCVDAHRVRLFDRTRSIGGRIDGERSASANRMELDRIESFWPWYGDDLDDKNFPQEVDRNEWRYPSRKDCYLGQETIARLDALGQVQKKLVHCELKGNNPPSAMTKIVVDGNDTGWICSFAYKSSNGPLHCPRLHHNALTFDASRELRVVGSPATIVRNSLSK